MPKAFNLSEDAILLLRFARGVALALWTAASFAMVVAVTFRDWEVASFFDRWFGSWGDVKLTLVACGMFAISFVAVKWTAASEQRFRAGGKL